MTEANTIMLHMLRMLHMGCACQYCHWVEETNSWQSVASFFGGAVVSGVADRTNRLEQWHKCG